MRKKKINILKKVFYSLLFGICSIVLLGSWSYDPQNDTITSDNLFDMDKLEYQKAWDNGSLINAPAYATNNIFININENTTYTVSYSTSYEVSLGYLDYYNNGVFISEISLGNLDFGVTRTFTTPNGVNQIALLWRYDYGVIQDNYINNVMFNIGSTALPFEPYGQTYINKNEYDGLYEDYESNLEDYNLLYQQYNDLQTDYQDLENNFLQLTNQFESLQTDYNDLQNQYSTLTDEYDTLLEEYQDLQTQYNTLTQQYNLLDEQINGFFNTYKLLFNNAKCYAINSLDTLYGKDISFQYANRKSINYDNTITIDNNNITKLSLPNFYNYMSGDYNNNGSNEIYYVLYVLTTYSDYSIFLDNLGENLGNGLWVNEISVLYENGFIVTGNAEQYNNDNRYVYKIESIENNPIIAFRVSYNINPNNLATNCTVNLDSSAMINNAYYQLGVSSLNQEIASKNATIDSLNANLRELRIQYNTIREQYDLISNKPLDLNFRNLIWYIAETPFTSFKTIWNVDFLGLNIASFVTGLLSVWVVLFIIKKIFK